jgi:hypothetical protein
LINGEDEPATLELRSEACRVDLKHVAVMIVILIAVLTGAYLGIRLA